MNRQLSRLLGRVARSASPSPSRPLSGFARSLLTLPFIEHQRPSLMRNEFRGFFPPGMNKWIEEMDKEMQSLWDRHGETWEEGGMKVSVGKDKYEICVDVRGFDPKEVVVTLKDNILTIEGKHEEKGTKGESYVSRQFTRSFSLPKGVEIDKAKSLIDKNGILRIEAPYNPPPEDGPKETPIQIRKM